MTPDRAQALKIANELMDTLTINPHQKNSAWPLETFQPLARDYLRLAARDHADFRRVTSEALMAREDKMAAAIACLNDPEWLKEHGQKLAEEAISHNRLLQLHKLGLLAPMLKAAGDDE